jgi:hypothetical protein
MSNNIPIPVFTPVIHTDSTTSKIYTYIKNMVIRQILNKLDVHEDSLPDVDDNGVLSENKQQLFYVISPESLYQRGNDEGIQTYIQYMTSDPQPNYSIVITGNSVRMTALVPYIDPTSFTILPPMVYT